MTAASSYPFEVWTITRDNRSAYCIGHLPTLALAIARADYEVRDGLSAIFSAEVCDTDGRVLYEV